MFTRTLQLLFFLNVIINIIVHVNKKRKGKKRKIENLWKIKNASNILKSAEKKHRRCISWKRHFSAFIPFAHMRSSLSTYWKGLSLARLFDPKIAEEIGTKVFAQKYELRNSRKILRGLGTLELAICSCFIRGII